ncbi:hypothetical protein MANES_13G077698v8 [Manihot esculenta]|uniref:Uncharacterized protein n=1 Tax=Manihot esculenta TaxID=3983 RepID=A0ACB7GKU8_MANES|nr:hypothetical protein MANES_13G077698v8 [Manihot esculenta]
MISWNALHHIISGIRHDHQQSHSKDAWPSQVLQPQSAWPGQVLPLCLPGPARSYNRVWAIGVALVYPQPHTHRIMQCIIFVKLMQSSY